MWGFLKDLNDKGTTIILTTHYLEEAEMLCRNIGIIQNGELVENTSMKALLRLKSETFILDLAPKVIYRYWKAISIVWLIRRRWRLRCCASRD
jgi:ABC-type multidrug transport system ATPase subunit